MNVENRLPIPASPQAEPVRQVDTPSDALASPRAAMPLPSSDDQSPGSAWAGMVEYASWFAYSA